jgi:5-amino-6-(5-phosphoribosylamino)uracil reductase
MRPKIICHMIGSIDGRLLVERWTDPAAGGSRTALLAQYETVASRFVSDGWIVGRTTMALHYAKAKARRVVPDGNIAREPFLGARNGRSLAVAIDPKGKLHYGRAEVDGCHIVAVLGEEVPDAYLAELREDGVSYLFAGPDGKDLAGALDILGGRFGATTLLLEGGGILNGAFLKAGLIDEISLLVYPGIDGSAGAPSIFEASGEPEDRPASGLSLRPLGSEILEGGLAWLHYAVESGRRPD